MAEPMPIAVVGAGGRMGRQLMRAVIEDERTELAGAVDRRESQVVGEDAGTVAGLTPIGVTVEDDALPVLARVEGVLDFTVPQATVETVALAAQARIVHVIGTTGCSNEDESRIDAAARHARIVKAGNMSLGVNMLAVLVERAAAALDAADWDIEVLEMHHRHKVDAPSGTALLLGEAAAKGRGIDLTQHSVRTRDGHTGPRTDGDIGFATLRGGSVVGEHSVLFAGEGETIELAHRAIDRSLFAKGAVAAALWARTRKPGRYDMRDVLGLSAD